MIATAWLKIIEKKHLLSASPDMIAASLHQMAEKYDPQVAPTTLRLPEAVHVGFREKVFLYREANCSNRCFGNMSASYSGNPQIISGDCQIIRSSVPPGVNP